MALGERPPMMGLSVSKIKCHYTRKPCMKDECALWTRFGEQEMCGDIVHIYRQDHIVEAILGVQAAIERRSNTEIQTAERLTHAFQKNIEKEVQHGLDSDKRRAIT